MSRLFQRRGAANSPPKSPLFRVTRKRRHGSSPGIVALLIALALAALAAALVVERTSLGLGKLGGDKQKASAPATGGKRKAVSTQSRYAVKLDTADHPVKVRFGKQPRGGLLFDLISGQVLWTRNPTRRLPIASLTKMMTALVVVKRAGAHERVRISKKALAYEGSGVGMLPGGKKVQLEALLNGLLLVSGNDTAIALAEHVAGSERAFVHLMNREARRMGLGHTRFASPHGVEDTNLSCAADLAALARADLAQPRIARIARRRLARPRFPGKGGVLWLYNNNPLVRTGYRGVTGLKTGYTKKAGRSLVATARRGRTHLGVVLLHSPDPLAQAKRLLDRGFAYKKSNRL